MNIVLNILVVIACAAIGGVIGYKEFYKRTTAGLEKKREKAEQLLAEAQTQAKEILDRAVERKTKAEEEMVKNIEMTKRLIDQMEKSTANKEQAIKRQEDKLNEAKFKVAAIEEEVSAYQQKLKNTEAKEKELLTSKTGKKEEEIKKEILKKYQAESEEDNKYKLANIIDEAKEKAPRLAQKIIVNAIQRLCSPTSVEPRAVQITVHKDVIKGKIVGKDAQNILYFEKLLDVDVVFNDLPNTISVSAFNLVNRRIAQKAIEKLVNTSKDINPRVIDEAIKRAKLEIDDELLAIGKKIVEKIGITGLDPELVRTIGRLQYRTSYGQNIMLHSMEVCYLATMLAAELGADIKTTRIAGFLHDLGKAIDQNPDVQGSHDFLTKELMEKYGFNKAEIHAAWTHHESEKPETVEALLIQAADALSASRPGARQESMEKYIERLRALEAVTSSFEGIKKSFAISAGREVRVIVDPMVINDAQTQELADKIAHKVESELSYPGKIKINVIRKTKTIETAR